MSDEVRSYSLVFKSDIKLSLSVFGLINYDLTLFHNYNFSCYPSTGLRIGQGVVVIFQIISAGGGYGLKLVVFQIGKFFARCPKSVVELNLFHMRLIFPAISLRSQIGSINSMFSPFRRSSC